VTVFAEEISLSVEDFLAAVVITTQSVLITVFFSWFSCQDTQPTATHVGLAHKVGDFSFCKQETLMQSERQLNLL